jgi:hypothetical protein
MAMNSLAENGDELHDALNCLPMGLEFGRLLSRENDAHHHGIHIARGGGLAGRVENCHPVQSGHA